MLTIKETTARRVCDIPGCRNKAGKLVRKKAGAFLAICDECMQDLSKAAVDSQETHIEKVTEKPKGKKAKA